MKKTLAFVVLLTLVFFGCTKSKTIDYPAALMLENEIYLLTETELSTEFEESEIIAYTQSYTDTYPEKNNETNFNRELNMPIVRTDGGVAVLYNNEWRFCTPEKAHGESILINPESDEWGLDMQMVMKEQNKFDVIFTRTSTELDGELITGTDFSVMAVYNGENIPFGEYMRNVLGYDYADPEIVWHLVAYGISPNNETVVSGTLDVYGTLPSGNYVLCKPVTLKKANGEKITREYTAEFAIVDENINVKEAFDAPVAIKTNEIVFEPYVHMLWVEEYSENGWLCGDGLPLTASFGKNKELTPEIAYNEDFELLIKENVTVGGISLYNTDESFERLYEINSLNELKDIPKGKYFLTVNATEYGEFISEGNKEETKGCECIFVLNIK